MCILFHTAICGLGLGLGLEHFGLGLGLDTAGLGLGTAGRDYKSAFNAHHREKKNSPFQQRDVALTEMEHFQQRLQYQ